MFRQFIAIACLLSVCAVANAKSTICKGGDGVGAVTSLAWDWETRIARVSLSPREQAPARVTSIRPHDKGFKVNIVVEFAKRNFGTDVTEYVVFTIGAGNYRILQVNYVLVDGQRLVNSVMDADDLTCETL